VNRLPIPGIWCFAHRQQDCELTSVCKTIYFRPICDETGLTASHVSFAGITAAQCEEGMNHCFLETLCYRIAIIFKWRPREILVLRTKINKTFFYWSVCQLMCGAFLNMSTAASSAELKCSAVLKLPSLWSGWSVRSLYDRIEVASEDRAELQNLACMTQSKFVSIFGFFLLSEGVATGELMGSVPPPPKLKYKALFKKCQPPLWFTESRSAE